MNERNNLDHGARQSMPLCPVSSSVPSMGECFSDAMTSQVAPYLHTILNYQSPMLHPSESARVLVCGSVRANQWWPFLASTFGPLLLLFFKLTDPDEYIAGPRLCFGGAGVEY